MKETRTVPGVSWLSAIVILLLSAMVFRPFIEPVLWALIVAYATWPMHRSILRMLHGQAVLSALTMTLLVALVFIGIALAVAIPLTRETVEFAHRLSLWSGREPERLASLAAEIPVVGENLSTLIRELPARKNELPSFGGGWMRNLSRIGQLAGRNAFQFVFTLFALFVVYRHSACLSVRVHELAHSLVGGRVDDYVASLRSVARAVLIGVPLTAMGQAALAGIGYWSAGVDEPLLLTLLTAVVALIPFGALFVWLPTGVALLMEGNVWGGIGLLLWGTLVVSSIDNVIRMFIVSNAVRMPFVLALLAFVGGLAAFGLIGLLIGPLVAEMLRLLWDEQVRTLSRLGSRRAYGARVAARQRRSCSVRYRREPTAARVMIRRKSKETLMLASRRDNS